MVSSINDVVSRVLRAFLCTNKDSKIKKVGHIGVNFQTISFMNSTLPKLVNQYKLYRWREEIWRTIWPFFLSNLLTHLAKLYISLLWLPILQMMTLSSKIPLHTHADNSITQEEVTSCILDNFQDLHFGFHIKSYV